MNIHIYPNELATIGNGVVLHIVNEDSTFTYCGKPINNNVFEGRRHFDDSTCTKCRGLSPHHFNDNELDKIYQARREKEDELRRARDKIYRKESKKIADLKNVIEQDIKEAMKKTGMKFVNYRYNGTMVFEANGIKIDVFTHS